MTSTINSKLNRVLGAKRLSKIEYIKSVLEVIVNSNSCLNYSSNEAFKDLIHKFSSANFFGKLTECFFSFEWNNMYQKAYENLISLIANRFTPEAIVRMMIEEIKLPEVLVRSLFEKSFLFDSGRKMFGGNFPLICEISCSIYSSENVVLRKIMDQNEKWKEFNMSFVVPIREKFQNGIQFPKENTFEDNDKPKSYERSETVQELYNRCKETLSFLPKSRENVDNVEKGDKEHNSSAKSDCSTGDASPLKQLSIKEDLNENLNPDFLDNNYWNRDVLDCDFEVI